MHRDRVPAGVLIIRIRVHFKYHTYNSFFKPFSGDVTPSRNSLNRLTVPRGQTNHITYLLRRSRTVYGRFSYSMSKDHAIPVPHQPVIFNSNFDLSDLPKGQTTKQLTSFVDLDRYMDAGHVVVDARVELRVIIVTMGRRVVDAFRMHVGLVHLFSLEIKRRRENVTKFHCKSLELKRKAGNVTLLLCERS